MTDEESYLHWLGVANQQIVRIEELDKQLDTAYAEYTDLDTTLDQVKRVPLHELIQKERRNRKKLLELLNSYYKLHQLLSSAPECTCNRCIAVRKFKQDELSGKI